MSWAYPLYTQQWGVAAASTGALFGTLALQSPWVIGFVVVVFLALAMSMFGAYFLVGHLMIKGFILPPFPTTTTGQSVTAQEKIDWVTSEEEGLRQATASSKVAMIDFYASWCAACMEFEKVTYTDPEVIKESKRFVNIKIDCTNSNDPKIKQLWDKYGVVGLPTIVFVGRDGNVLKDKTITGFINPREFLRIIKSLE